MSRSFPIASLLLAAPAMLSFTSCDTVYSRTYSYQKTSFAVVTKKDGSLVIDKSYVFQPYERDAKARAEMDKEKREADRLRMAAESSQKMSADKIGTDAPSLKMDSGLADIPSAATPTSSASIPGLDAPSVSAPASTPGMAMDGASMSGASMSTPSMSGASTAPAMDGSSMTTPSMTPSAPAAAPGAAPAKPAATMLPGL